MRNRKVMIICLMTGYRRKISLYRMSFYPEPDSDRNKIKVELNLYNYETKSKVKEAAGFETSGFATKADLATTIHKIYWTNSSFHVK